MRLICRRTNVDAIRAEVYCSPQYAEGFGDIQILMLRAEHEKQSSSSAGSSCNDDPGGRSRSCDTAMLTKEMLFRSSKRFVRDGEPLVFTIRLVGVEQFDVTAAQFWELDVESKLEAAENWRVVGNALFNDAKYAEASQLYHKAVSYVETVLEATDGPTAEESDENAAVAKRLRRLLVPLHLNRAAAFIKQQSFVEARRSCEQVLVNSDNDPRQAKNFRVKAIFRLGQIACGTHEYAQAESHWKHVAVLAREGGNHGVAKSAENEITKMKQGNWAKAKAREKKIAAKMFGMGDNDGSSNISSSQATRTLDLKAMSCVDDALAATAATTLAGPAIKVHVEVASREAEVAQRERLEMEAEVAALQAKLKVAEEVLRRKTEAKKLRDEQLLHLSHSRYGGNRSDPSECDV